MGRALYTLKDGEVMARRAYYMHASRDGGKTFTRYKSVGAFERLTGHRVTPTWRAARIKEGGGLSLKVGDRTPEVFHAFQGIPYAVYFERKK